MNHGRSNTLPAKAAVERLDERIVGRVQESATAAHVPPHIDRTGWFCRYSPLGLLSDKRVVTPVPLP